MKKRNLGFSLIELIVVLALITMIARLVFTSFNALNSRQALDKEVDYVKTLIQKTRLDSLNSKNGATFRIRFENNQITVYQSGTTTTAVYPFSTNVRLNTIGLTAVSGGAATTTVSFAKITGLAGAQGTLTFGLVVGATTTISKSVVINALGTVE
jgi:prepilin-type N-terminal cleavage/methylation domain-containing protein